MASEDPEPRFSGRQSRAGGWLSHMSNVRPNAPRPPERSRAVTGAPSPSGTPGSRAGRVSREAEQVRRGGRTAVGRDPPRAGARVSAARRGSASVTGRCACFAVNGCHGLPGGGGPCGHRRVADGQVGGVDGAQGPGQPYGGVAGGAAAPASRGPGRCRRGRERGAAHQVVPASGARETPPRAERRSCTCSRRDPRRCQGRVPRPAIRRGRRCGLLARRGPASCGSGPDGAGGGAGRSPRCRPRCGR